MSNEMQMEIDSLKHSEHKTLHIQKTLRLRKLCERNSGVLFQIVVSRRGLVAPCKLATSWKSEIRCFEIIR